MVIPSTCGSPASCSSLQLSAIGYLPGFLHHPTPPPPPPRLPESKQICKEKKKTQPHTQRTRARLLSLAHEVIAAAAAHAGCFRRPPAQSGTLQAAHVGARHGSSPSTTVVAVKGFFKEMSRTPWTCSSSSGGSQIHRCKDRENWASHYFFQNWVLVLSKLN
nr:uncharacterized protein LOC109765838 [Aegilops tauschii subsp. strangulata]